MRLIDADELKNKLQARHDNGGEDFDKGYNIGLGTAIDLIDSAPAVTSKVEFVTKNGITFPKALEMMTYSHELTTEERQNIEKAYMLGVYTNTRPHGKWNDKKVAFYLECSNCGALVSGYQPNIFLENEKLNYCPNCGADMRQEESE